MTNMSSVDGQIRIEIEYCGELDYLPEASSLAAAIKDEFDIVIELIEGHSGIFRVVVNGKTVFDKAGMSGKPAPPVVDILAYVRGLVG